MMEEAKISLRLSALKKTWIFDLDGTLVVHNKYKTGRDQLLPGVKDFFADISKDDCIIILTGREQEAALQTEQFLEEEGIRYDLIFYGVPLGERILFNDTKPSGLKTCYAVELERDHGLTDIAAEIDTAI